MAKAGMEIATSKYINLACSCQMAYVVILHLQVSAVTFGRRGNCGKKKKEQNPGAALRNAELKTHWAKLNDSSKRGLTSAHNQRTLVSKDRALKVICCRCQA